MGHTPVFWPGEFQGLYNPWGRTPVFWPREFQGLYSPWGPPLYSGLENSMGSIVHGVALLYSSLENSMGSIVHGVAKSWTQLSNAHFSRISCTTSTPSPLASRSYPIGNTGKECFHYHRKVLQMVLELVPEREKMEKLERHSVSKEVSSHLHDHSR